MWFWSFYFQFALYSQPCLLLFFKKGLLVAQVHLQLIDDDLELQIFLPHLPTTGFQVHITMLVHSVLGIKPGTLCIPHFTCSHSLLT